MRDLLVSQLVWNIIIIIVMPVYYMELFEEYFCDFLCSHTQPRSIFSYDMIY